MPWDIKWKSGKLLVILTAVHWNILNGGVIVFLISSARVCVYLFTCSVNKDSVCCDPVTPPPNPLHTQLRMKNPFELREPPQDCLCWREEHYCSLSRQLKKDKYSPEKSMDYFLYEQTNELMRSYTPLLGSCWGSTLVLMFNEINMQDKHFNRDTFVWFLK